MLESFFFVVGIIYLQTVAHENDEIEPNKITGEYTKGHVLSNRKVILHRVTNKIVAEWTISSYGNCPNTMNLSRYPKAMTTMMRIGKEISCQLTF
jgi:hypothetical protein